MMLLLLLLLCCVDDAVINYSFVVDVDDIAFVDVDVVVDPDHMTLVTNLFVHILFWIFRESETV